MIENRPMMTVVTHIVLLLGIAMIAFPIWITFVAATHTPIRMLQVPLPLLPGDQFLVNIKATLFGSGLSGTQTAPVWLMLLNSLIMALGISLGKIVISLLSAFAIVYFRFPFRMFFFWMIFCHSDVAGRGAHTANLRSSGQSGVVKFLSRFIHAIDCISDCDFHVPPGVSDNPG